MEQPTTKQLQKRELIKTFLTMLLKEKTAPVENHPSPVEKGYKFDDVAKSSYDDNKVSGSNSVSQ